MKKITTVFSLLLVILAAFSIFFFNPRMLTPEDPTGKTIYYTMIESENVKLNDEKRYEYTLNSYDEKGNEKKLNFTASKQLREGAYLELYVATFRGVTYWQEVKYEELPEVIQEIYNK
ncbi:hypothetical protein CLPU_4c00960 [Gottschalkia purinilytica]|uniref:YxeA family protein n=1 Tax=Gottschalkia purinilytica TaxID=1503 RepID=A0A0L0WCB7_GOTPU|nr:YxeA family protein [Gottschalkia purinilytica]KNF09050.1 hypothetical protein CLPU_4c00960 [Gottschalkia purinilytica]